MRSIALQSHIFKGRTIRLKVNRDAHPAKRKSFSIYRMNKNHLLVACSILVLVTAAFAVVSCVLLAVYIHSLQVAIPAPEPGITPSASPEEAIIPTWTITPPEKPAGMIGASGIGDPYYPLMGNGGYDVQHYDLNLNVDMALERISATAVITARSTQALDRFDLDLLSLTVESVKVDGVNAAFEHPQGELVVIPAERLPANADFTVTVVYSGKPENDPSLAYLDGWSFYPDGVIVAGEPTGAENWFPVNNHPLDKATYTISVTVAEPYVVAANGILKARTENGNGTWSYVWEMDDPMASYLSTVAIGRFEGIEDSTASGVPIRSYVDSDLLPDAEVEIRSIPEILDYYETVFGPYPFDACGVVVHDLPLWFALEDQTLVVLGSYFDETTIVHELAHQWYGDSVSLAKWQDIWLNEGFASYAEVLWLEHSAGREDADGDIRSRYEMLARDGSGFAAIGDPGPEDLFGMQVYHRGALTLHAMRLQVGDDAFFRILRTYADRYAGRNASTEDFIAIAEEISGQDLGDFFNRWLYQTDLPDIPEIGLFQKDFQ